MQMHLIVLFLVVDEIEQVAEWREYQGGVAFISSAGVVILVYNRYL